MRFLINPLLPALGLAPLAGIGWFGLAVGQGSWFATGGLLLSLVAVAFGVLVYRLTRPAQGLVAQGGAAVFTGGEPLGPKGRLGATDFSQLMVAQLAPFYRAVDVDRAYLAAWHGLNALAERLHAGFRRAEAWAVPLLAGFCALLGLAAFRLAAAPAAGGEAEGAAHWLLVGSVTLAWAALASVCAASQGTRRLLPYLLGSGLLALAGMTFGTPPGPGPPAGGGGPGRPPGHGRPARVPVVPGGPGAVGPGHPGRHPGGGARRPRPGHGPAAAPASPSSWDWRPCACGCPRWPSGPRPCWAAW